MPSSQTEQPRSQSDAVTPPESVARYIRNLRITSEDTLRAVQAPCEFAPTYRLDSGGYTENGHGLANGVKVERTDTARFNGVFHARLDEYGSRDVTLFHFRGTVWAYRGWYAPGDQHWEPVYGNHVPTTMSYGEDFPSDSDLSKYLTQFVRLPSGILIIPQEARAAVYDGYNILYLGYSRGPSSPEPQAPNPLSYLDGSTRKYYPNGGGYNFNGRVMPWSFGVCRVGTVDVSGNVGNFEPTNAKKTNPNGGVLKEGMIRAKLQWINEHGDLSPASPPSTAWTCQMEDNVSKERKSDEDEMAAKLRLQCWWGGLQAGPAGTTGRILSKTRDLINSGDPTFYEIPANASAGFHEFATLPDNVCDFYPDNTPESWLLLPTTEVDPMPVFKVACLFAGRLWIGNAKGDPGLVRASMQGRWGTMPKGEYIYYPDSTGAEVTGLHANASGLLVFTERSTFLVTQNDGGDSFKFAVLSTSVGCVSPNSIATLPNGLTIWLSREGFHAFDGNVVKEISKGEIDQTIRRINPMRRHRAVAVVDPDQGEYRCWVPLDRSDFNDFCVVFDGQSWRERDDMTVDCACVTDDSRQYILAAGAYPRATSGTLDSLFILDRAAAWVREYAYTSPPVSALVVPKQPVWTFRSTWLRASRAHRRGSPMRLRLWMRESQSSRVRLRVFRDWRESPAIYDVLAEDDKAVDRYSSDDPPAFVGETNLGAQLENNLTRTIRGTKATTPAAFRRRRPFWSKVDIMVPSCEVFAFELEGQGDFEFVGFQYLENAMSHHGGNNQPGGKR
jgi:hypothetical protein